MSSRRTIPVRSKSCLPLLNCLLRRAIRFVSYPRTKLLGNHCLLETLETVGTLGPSGDVARTPSLRPSCSGGRNGRLIPLGCRMSPSTLPFHLRCHVPAHGKPANTRQHHVPAGKRTVLDSIVSHNQQATSRPTSAWPAGRGVTTRSGRRSEGAEGSATSHGLTL